MSRRARDLKGKAWAQKTVFDVAQYRNTLNSDTVDVFCNRKALVVLQADDFDGESTFDTGLGHSLCSSRESRNVGKVVVDCDRNVERSVNSFTHVQCLDSDDLP
jgi:hypothetical protein